MDIERIKEEMEDDMEDWHPDGESTAELSSDELRTMLGEEQDDMKKVLEVRPAEAIMPHSS